MNPIPVDLAQHLRAQGATLDIVGTMKLYAPLLREQNRAGVKIIHDQVYGTDARHRLDVYLPESASGSLPVLIFVHGGGFIQGDKSGRDNFGLCFARAGFVVVVINYRLAPAHRWPAGAEDVIAAYRWTRAHVAQYGGDTGRIFLMGESAGAAHVALATLVSRFHSAQGLPLAGVVLLAGVYNVQLEKLARTALGIATPDPRNEAYFGTDFARYTDMSTVNLIDAPPVPLLISYAELDLPQMQVQAGELFARLVTQHGYEPQLCVIAGHNHLSQFFAVNTGDESLTTPVLDWLRARS